MHPTSRSALYMGRALSYSAALAADKLNHVVPAVTDVAGSAAGTVVAHAAGSGWREILRFVALPGLGVAGLLCLMPENRAPGGVDSIDVTMTEDGEEEERFNVLSLLKVRA